MNQYLHPEGIVIVPGWVAAKLEAALPLDDYRQSEQLVNRKLYEVLEALHLAAVAHRSSVGTNLAELRNVNRESYQMEVAEAAGRARVSAEYLRRELRAGRLIGHKTDDSSRWLVSETDFLNWQQGRRTRLRLRS